MSFVNDGNNDLPPPYTFAVNQTFPSRLAQNIQPSAPLLVHIDAGISSNINSVLGVHSSLTTPRVTSPIIHPPIQPSRNITWVDCSNGDIPPNSLLAGYDKDNSPLYAGAAWLENELLPAKICPNHGCAYVSNAGYEIRLNVYKVMSSNNVVWQNCSYGNVPPGAIECGFTVNGEKLYMGRCHHDGTLTLGKIHPSHHCLYIPYDGRELSFNNYEVAVLMNQETEAPSNVPSRHGIIYSRATCSGVSPQLLGRIAGALFFIVFFCFGYIILKNFNLSFHRN